MKALLALLDAAEDSAKRILRYGRIARLLSALWFLLMGASAVAAAAYFVLGPAHWSLAAVGAGLALASLAVGRLEDRYYRKALEELDRLEGLICALALLVGPPKAPKKEAKEPEAPLTLHRSEV